MRYIPDPNIDLSVKEVTQSAKEKGFFCIHRSKTHLIIEDVESGGHEFLSCEIAGDLVVSVTPDEGDGYYIMNALERELGFRFQEDKSN